MRILFVAHGADMMGANRCLLDLVTGLTQRGVDPILLVPGEGPMIAELQERGIKYLIAKYYNWSFTRYVSISYWLHPLRAWQNQQLLPSLCQLVEKEQIDLIYTNSSQTGIGAFIAEKLSLPHLWHIREFGEKDYNHSFWRGRAYFRKWANKATAIISMSQAIYDEVLTQVKAPKHVIHDGIIAAADYQQVAAKTTKPAAEDFVFLIIGALHPTKGQLRALKAFKELAKRREKVQLKIVGKGRKIYTKRLQHFIQKHRLEKKAFLLGYVKKPFEIHHQADATLMCSRMEGMGRVTLEAMLHSNPVIGFNAGGTTELINQEADGYIYNNHEELVTYLEKLVDDPAKALEMGRNGHEKIGRAYTLEVSVDKIFKVIESCLASDHQN